MQDTIKETTIETFPPVKRNTLTFNEAWEEIFERAVSKDKLYAEVRAKKIPHTRVGSKILFRRDTLLAWFHEQEIKNYLTQNDHAN